MTTRLEVRELRDRWFAKAGRFHSAAVDQMLSADRAVVVASGPRVVFARKPLGTCSSRPTFCLNPRQRPWSSALRRSISRIIIGVKMSCIARSILPPGHTIVFGRDMNESWSIASR